MEPEPLDPKTEPVQFQDLHGSSFRAQQIHIVQGPVTHQHPGGHPPRRRAVLVGVAVVLLVGAAFSGWYLLRDRGPAPGTALQPTVLGTADVGDGSSVVFPPGQEAAAALFASAPKTPDGRQRARVAATGAYLLSGMRLSLQFGALTDHEVVIYDLRTIDVARRPVIDGTVVQSGPEGGGPDLMTYNLDAPGAVARSEPVNGHGPGDAYFETNHPALSRGQSQTFDIIFTARSGAYDYRVAVDYELDGAKYTQVVDQDGQPFRVTAAICPRRPETATLHYRRITDIGVSHPEPTPVPSISTDLYCPEGPG